MPDTLENAGSKPQVATCIWCDNPAAPPNVENAPVCPRCYQLLRRAGIQDYEIFDFADKRTDNISDTDLNNPSDRP